MLDLDLAQELGRTKDAPGTSLDRVVEVADQLMEFLTVESDVLSILDGYLRRPGQTWDDFFQTKSKDERHYYEFEIFCNKEELVKILLDLVDGLESILKQSPISDVSRANDDQPEEIVYKIVKVWFAIDGIVIVDTEFVGRRSEREGNYTMDLLRLPYHASTRKVNLKLRRD